MFKPEDFENGIYEKGLWNSRRIADMVNAKLEAGKTTNNYQTLVEQLIKDLNARGKWTTLLINYAKRRDLQIEVAQRRLAGETFSQIAATYGMCKQNVRHLFNKGQQR